MPFRSDYSLTDYFRNCGDKPYPKDARSLIVIHPKPRGTEVVLASIL